MVKIRAPVLSQAATGSIADVLTFSSAKGRAYLKRKPTPAQPRSGLQVSMRAMMTFLSQQWQNLQAAKQDTWANAYPDPQLNNYNAFIRHNLERWRRKAWPTKAYPATETGSVADDLHLTATGGVRNVKLDAWIEHLFRDNWTGHLFHSPIELPIRDLDKLVHIFKLDDADHKYFTHSPLAAGTHHYCLQITTDDGNFLVPASASDTAIVT